MGATFTTGKFIAGIVIAILASSAISISACIQNRMRASDIATFQIGTHPAVTASPIAYQLVNAAEMALKKHDF